VATVVVGVAMRIGGDDFVRAVIDTNLEFFPEVRRPGNKGWRGARVFAGRNRNERPVRFGQFDVDEDLDDLLALGAMVELGLLSAVVAEGLIGTGDDLDEGRVEADGRNVRAGFGRREKPGVLRKETGIRAVMALAEEVSFANGFGGERRLETKTGNR